MIEGYVWNREHCVEIRVPKVTWSASKMYAILSTHLSEGDSKVCTSDSWQIILKGSVERSIEKVNLETFKFVWKCKQMMTV